MLHAAVFRLRAAWLYSYLGQLGCYVITQYDYEESGQCLE